MSDETGRTSGEDRFFGVTNTVTEPEDAPVPVQEGDIEIEIVDDRPLADQVDDQAQGADSIEEDAATDKEIESYGLKAYKRMKKLKWEYHQERRAKEKSERISAEALNYTQSLQTENQNLLKLVAESQQALTARSQHGADATLAIARDNFKKAHESGDSDELAAAQEYLTNAQLAQAAAPGVSQEVINNWKQQVSASQREMAQQQQAAPQVPEPDGMAMEWQESNPWFGVDKEMTSFAYGVHEKLISEDGIDPSSPAYYQLINKRMGEVFPAHFGNDAAASNGSVAVETAPRRRANPVVASVSRNNGPAPRKFVLTSSEVAVAKRIGVTPEQYARQKMKEEMS
tara:strand:+ start:1217 stop:2245 length:1029 start_codon:yes stop_codon:yes gene_type:complete